MVTIRTLTIPATSLRNRAVVQVTTSTVTATVTHQVRSRWPLAQTSEEFTADLRAITTQLIVLAFGTTRSATSS